MKEEGDWMKGIRVDVRGDKQSVCSSCIIAITKAACRGDSLGHPIMCVASQIRQTVQGTETVTYFIQPSKAASKGLRMALNVCV